ncbi:hypothetical protein [Neisseria zalophi]|uniref:Uncharacterized protein n=1 Tax=Neisseria zalophi TaxID=640030 RepID=A0A5J6PZZ2_9NEIS|nr:hypothetical protein [Neisseria zalophi]QEY26240.1 hypothetical protein D0T92_06695 [Neisseria zalophi]
MNENLYDDPKIQLFLQETKDYFLSLSIEDIQLAYSRINLAELEWFYARNTSYIEYIEHENEASGFKYKVFKRPKKFSSIKEALDNDLDCSGLLGGKQLVCFQSNTDISYSNYNADMSIEDGIVYFKIKNDFKTIFNKMSFERKIYLDDDVVLRILVAGNWGERSVIKLDFYNQNNQKIKTITSSNDERKFKQYIHKVPKTLFYEYEGETLKRIFTIEKDGQEDNIYYKK